MLNYYLKFNFILINNSSTTSVTSLTSTTLAAPPTTNHKSGRPRKIQKVDTTNITADLNKKVLLEGNLMFSGF
ncbi:hypothetical protein Glove_19g425 [Diversispora epigaea]|uniref:Uncharacterized protein n=1 Tax=Diversispora epigaea TaxID=1348612 RepID=A0A397JVV2_9GLOM|nr:hypothetical protein Glove_19g425 [Diversispora epigaea]